MLGAKIEMALGVQSQRLEKSSWLRSFARIELGVTSGFEVIRDG